MASRRSAKKIKLLLFSIIFNVLATIKRKKRRSCWVRKWIGRRSQLGFSNTIVKELTIEDSAEFRGMFRMDVNSFKYLLDKISPHITKSDTFFRKSISAAEKLQITLRYLATGMIKKYFSCNNSIVEFLPGGIVKGHAPLRSFFSTVLLVDFEMIMHNEQCLCLQCNLQ